MSDTNQQPPQQPTMLSFSTALPNLCSLAGLSSAVLGIYFAVLGNFPAAIIGILWAVVFDWADGIIARSIPGRTEHDRAFGSQLDSLIDIISFGVFPAVFLLSYGGYNPWFLPGAILIMAAAAIRLSYFNVFGLIDSHTYKGLALDNNVLLLAFVFLFEGFFHTTVFSIVLYALLIVLLVLNTSSLSTPKLAGKWFYILIAYAVVMTGLYGWMQLVSLS
jgi:phosphatidylserine synthase